MNNITKSPYFTLNNLVVDSSGEIITSDEYEFRQRTLQIPHSDFVRSIFPHDGHMLKESPEMEGRVKELLAEATKDYNKYYNLLSSEEHLLSSLRYAKKTQQALKDINKYRRMLMWVSYSKNFDKDRAKIQPIDDFVTFRNNTAKCLWHKDITPSLHYYPKTNSVFCFACGKYGDVIDVVMALRNCDFKEAVNFLNNTS
jgi:hypothetical protein